jgi:hypothetical protein
MGAVSSRDGARALHFAGIFSGRLGRVACLFACVVALEACKPQFADTLPAGFHVDRTFGQLYDDAGTKKASHFVIVTLPAPTVLTVSDGTIEYVPGTSAQADGLGNCLLLRSRTYPITENNFDNLKAIPSPSSIVLAFCNMVEADVKQAARNLYQSKLIGASASELDDAANHFIAGDDTFKQLDVVSSNANPMISSILGKVDSNRLYLAAFTEDDAGKRTYVNSLPYLAGVIPATKLDAVPPVLDEVVIETSASGDFAVDGVLHPIVGNAIAAPLPRHYMRVGVRSTEKMMATGEEVVPYRISAVLTNNTVTPAVRMRSTALLNQLAYSDAAEIARQSYGAQGPVTSVPGVGVYWMFPVWNPVRPAASAGEDAVNALGIPNHFLDLNLVGGEEEVYPGGPYELALTVGDIPNAAPTRTISFTLKPGIRLRVMQDTNNDHQIGGSDQALGALQVARWDNAYTGATFDVRNNADPDNFVDRDPSRFYLRISDANANTNAGGIDTIHARIGTLDGAMAVNDDATDIELTETGANTGEFLSRSQILTSNKLDPAVMLPCGVGSVACEDDEFRAHDGSPAGAPVADDAPNDRTHRADIEGKVRVLYRPAGETSDLGWNIDVCGTDRRKVLIRFVVFREPFLNDGLDGIPNTHDTGEGNTGPDGNPAFDFTDTNLNGRHDAGEPSEKYVDISHGATILRSGAQAGVQDGWGPVVTDQYIDLAIDRANKAWSPACIKFVKDGATRIGNAPLDRVHHDDVLLDNNVTYEVTAADPHPDAEEIFLSVSPFMSTDTVTAIYAGQLPGAAAVAFAPLWQDISQGEKTFTIIDPFQPQRRRTLAHELWHLLTNQGDSVTDQPFFCPSQDPSNGDTAVNTYRRFSETIKNNAQTVRPAGDLSHVGNSLRKPL